MYRSKIYESYVSTGYGDINKRISTERIVISYTHNYMRHLGDNKQKRILEIGCGMGHFQEFLRRSGFANTIAIDIGPEQIDYCKEHIDGEFILVKDSNKYLASNQQTYDIIVMNDVIEHFTKSETLAILDSIRQAMRPGGRLILRTPNMAAFFAAASRYGDFTHENGFTERSARQVLAASGFYKVRCYPERSYIQSPLMRLAFSILSTLRLGILRAFAYLERPGDRYPTIFSKNIIIVADINRALADGVLAVNIDTK